jgi:hypothetical protein
VKTYHSGEKETEQRALAAPLEMLKVLRHVITV